MIHQSIPLLGIYTPLKSGSQTNIYTSMFTEAPFTLAKTCIKLKCLLMSKENLVYVCNKILFSHKKKEILLFATIYMDLVGITLNEVIQTQKHKSCMISHICET